MCGLPSNVPCSHRRTLVQLARLDAVLAARITESHSIIAFRNILVHAYAQVDDLTSGASSKRNCRLWSAKWLRFYG